jgi:hypothetical protein
VGDDQSFERIRRKIRKDAPIHRNLPAINGTIYQHQEDWIRGMERESGLGYSRLLREIIEAARRSGYTPGSVTVRELSSEAHRYGRRTN